MQDEKERESDFKRQNTGSVEGPGSPLPGPSKLGSQLTKPADSKKLKRFGTLEMKSGIKNQLRSNIFNNLMSGSPLAKNASSKKILIDGGPTNQNTPLDEQPKVRPGILARRRLRQKS